MTAYESTAPEPMPRTRPYVSNDQHLPLVSTQKIENIFSNFEELQDVSVTPEMARGLILEANGMTKDDVTEKRRELNAKWGASVLMDVPLQFDRQPGKAPMQVVDPTQYSLATRRIQRQLDRLDVIAKIKADTNPK